MSWRTPSHAFPRGEESRQNVATCRLHQLLEGAGNSWVLIRLKFVSSSIAAAEAVQSFSWQRACDWSFVRGFDGQGNTHLCCVGCVQR